MNCVLGLRVGVVLHLGLTDDNGDREREKWRWRTNGLKASDCSTIDWNRKLFLEALYMAYSRWKCMAWQSAMVMMIAQMFIIYFRINHLSWNMAGVTIMALCEHNLSASRARGLYSGYTVIELYHSHLALSSRWPCRILGGILWPANWDQWSSTPSQSMRFVPMAIWRKKCFSHSIISS